MCENNGVVGRKQSALEWGPRIKQRWSNCCQELDARQITAVLSGQIVEYSHWFPWRPHSVSTSGWWPILKAKIRASLNFWLLNGHAPVHFESSPCISAHDHVQVLVWRPYCRAFAALFHWINDILLRVYALLWFSRSSSFVTEMFWLSDCSRVTGHWDTLRDSIVCRRNR